MLRIGRASVGKLSVNFLRQQKTSAREVFFVFYFEVFLVGFDGVAGLTGLAGFVSFKAFIWFAESAEVASFEHAWQQPFAECDLTFFINRFPP